jgi:hypothetical protein
VQAARHVAWPGTPVACVAREGAVTPDDTADTLSPRTESGLQPAALGAGPLYQRDYWAVIDRCRSRPSEVIALVADRFTEFPSPDTVEFRRVGAASAPLDVGDELDIAIRMAGTCRVRVIHKDACSFTLGTLEGHPEAGRITFGAYRNDRGDVVFHIRSRARSGSLPHYLGFLTGGDPMQTTTWTDFVNTVALTCGDGVVGFVHAETVELEPADIDGGDEAMNGPTFVAEAD